MGTNYYALTSGKVLTESNIDNTFHIGKISYGWVFHFQAHPELEVTTLESMKEYLVGKDIFNEYFHLVKAKDFWEMVENSKLPLKDGRKRKVLTDPENPQPLMIGDYEENGYAWTTIPFS